MHFKYDNSADTWLAQGLHEKSLCASPDQKYLGWLYDYLASVCHSNLTGLGS